MADLDQKQSKGMKMVIAYPFGVLALAIVLNLFVLEINTFKVGLPASQVVIALAVAGILLSVNHTWLMTATEITRVKYKMYATPEEWAASGTSLKDIPEAAIHELERTHNAHRNTTENTVYFLMLLIPFVLSTPSNLAAYIWLIGFSVARLGYTLSYLKGSDNFRGVFMTLGLISAYGIACYLVFSLLKLF